MKCTIEDLRGHYQRKRNSRVQRFPRPGYRPSTAKAYADAAGRVGFWDCDLGLWIWYRGTPDGYTQSGTTGFLGSATPIGD